LAVQFDLVVEGRKDLCQPTLFTDAPWVKDADVAQKRGIEGWHRGPYGDRPYVVFEGRESEEVGQESWIHFARVGSNAQTTPREQPALLGVSDESAPVDRPDATEDDISRPKRIFLQPRAIGFRDPRHTVVDDSIFTKMFNGDDGCPDRNVVFLVELAAEWPGLDAGFRHAKIREATIDEV